MQLEYLLTSLLTHSRFIYMIALSLLIGLIYNETILLFHSMLFLTLNVKEPLNNNRSHIFTELIPVLHFTYDSSLSIRMTTCTKKKSYWKWCIVGCIEYLPLWLTVEINKLLFSWFYQYQMYLVLFFISHFNNFKCRCPISDCY